MQRWQFPTYYGSTFTYLIVHRFEDMLSISTSFFENSKRYKDAVVICFRQIRFLESGRASVLSNYLMHASFGVPLRSLGTKGCNAIISCGAGNDADCQHIAQGAWV
jgi:hypothetical protein